MTSRSVRRSGAALIETLDSRRLLAATPTLIGDINQTRSFLDPSNITAVGSIAFFAGRMNSANGQELFKTDGTATGTVLVKAINTVNLNGSTPSNLTNVNGTLYFAADDGVSGRELWKSDGTAAGTVRVADLNTGSAASSPTSLTNVNGKLYFAATDGSGVTLWKSDGTAAGTVKVTLSGSGNTLVNPANLVSYNGVLFLSAGSSTSTSSLYRVDTAGASVVGSVVGPTRLTVFSNAVYFTLSTNSSDASNGDLWKTDGTSAGTVRVKQIDALNGSTDFARAYSLTVSSDRLYFVDGDFSQGKFDLWTSDGSTAGTVKLSSDGSFANNTLFVPVGTRSVLFSHTAAATGTEPWVSDGTASGTTILKDTVSGAGSPAYTLSFVPIGGGKDLFAQSSQLGGPVQLWTTTGTTASTAVFTTVTDTPNVLLAIGSVNNIAYLWGVRYAGTGSLYRSDGTVGGTARLNANLTANDDSLIEISGNFRPIFYTIGDTVYFAADDGVSGQELYKAVGNAAPVRVADLTPGGGDSQPNNFASGSDGSLYFVATNATTSSRNLYRLAPAASTPTVVYPVSLDSNGSGGSFSNISAVGNLIYFRLTTSASGFGQLWKFDPSTNTTSLVTVNSGDTLDVSAIVQAGSKWYFGGIEYRGSSIAVYPQQRLYNLDGTGATPLLVADISSGNSSSVSYSGPIGAMGSTIFFSASTANAGTELWKSNGTSAGTTLVADLTPGIGSTNFDDTFPGQTLSYNGTLYFTARNATDEFAWRTDGTAAGTSTIGGISAAEPEFTASAGNVYFIGAATGGVAVYRVDGTAATAVTSPGSGDTAFQPYRLMAAGNSVYSIGQGGAAARWELWQATANFSSFSKVAVLGPITPPTVNSVNLYSFFVYGRLALAATSSNLIFPMYSDVSGVEPYRLALFSPPVRQSVAVGSGVAQGFTVVVHYDQALNAAVNLSGATLQNQTTNTAIASSSIKGTVSGNDLILRFTVLSNGLLPDGNYQLNLPANVVATAGGAAASDAFTFQVLAGDLDHNGIVDISDLSTLAQNWQHTGVTNAQGDVNDDGIVDISDLGLLATNWQKSLPAIVTPQTKAAVKPVVKPTLKAKSTAAIKPR